MIVTFNFSHQRVRNRSAGVLSLGSLANSSLIVVLIVTNGRFIAFSGGGRRLQTKLKEAGNIGWNVA
jgi:hypothetical protein